MKNKRTLLGMAAAGILAGSFLLSSVMTVNADSGIPADSLRGGRGGQGGRGSQGGSALTPLSDVEKQGLQDGILEEWGAMQTYLSISAQIGGESVFDEIAASEQRHLDTLIRQAEKYGVELPAMNEISPVEFGSLEEACAIGAAAEIADAELYDVLMAQTERSDLLRVYTNLQRASLELHLSAFESCD